MTRKEKVYEVKPDAVCGFYVGGVKGCPSKYDFLNLPKMNYDNCGHDSDCNKCWNTEWGEPEKPQWQQNILDKFMKVI